MITINMTKAKAIGHEIRRAKREQDFKPYDEAIAKQIPGQAEGAEAARVLIRQQYAEVQVQIDAATTPDEIKSALGM